MTEISPSKERGMTDKDKKKEGRKKRGNKRKKEGKYSTSMLVFGSALN